MVLFIEKIDLESHIQNSSSPLATDRNDDAGLEKHALVVPPQLLKQKYPEIMTMAKNHVLAQQDDMVDFKAIHSGLSGLQTARYARTMKASHPEKSFSRAFSMIERFFEVNSIIEGKCASRGYVTSSLKEFDWESNADGDFLPDFDDDSTGMESDSDPDEKSFCTSQPLGKSMPQSLANDDNNTVSIDNNLQ